MASNENAEGVLHRWIRYFRPGKCVWEIDKKWYHAVYNTGCQVKHFGGKYNRSHNNERFKYCPYCGREIEVKDET